MFYSESEFNNWLKENKNIKIRDVKYYKGLGTSTTKEAKEYFHPSKKREIVYEYTGEESDGAINLAFNDKCIE